MRKRWGFVTLVAAIAGAASASFELVIVADNGQNNFATRRIHRFDGPSGAYLGSFGRFNSDIRSSVLIQETNSLLVSNNDGTFEYDYNTGILKQSWAFSGGFGHVVLNPDRSRAYFFNQGSPQIFWSQFPNLNSGGSTNGVAGAVWTSGIFLTQSTMLAWDNGSKQARLLQFDPTGNTFAIVASNSFNASPTVGQMARVGGSGRIVFAGTTGTLIFEPTFLGLPPSFGPAGANSAATAHSGYYLGFENGGNGVVRHYNGSGILVNELGSGILARPVSVQTVLAPEPATMTALTLGLAALVRRRRLKKN